MLPHMDGREIICQARAAGVDTPIIVVSALGAISDRVAGLALGADDYLQKPCAMAELKARIMAFNRRFKGTQERVISLGGITLDTASRVCKRNGRSIDLSKIEFTILECLMRHRGTLVPKSLLIEQAWGYDMDPTTSIVPPHVSRLRAKLSVDGDSTAREPGRWTSRKSSGTPATSSARPPRTWGSSSPATFPPVPSCSRPTPTGCSGSSATITLPT